MKKSYHKIQATYQPRQYKQFPEARPGYKWCVDCELEKPFEAFHKMGDGYRPVCKVCRKKRKQEKEEAIPIQQPLFILSKICTKCNQEKDLDEFDYCAKGKYERFSQCKYCRSGYNYRFRQEHLEEVQKRERLKNARSETKARQRRRHRERSATDPEYLEMRIYHRGKYYQGHKVEAKELCMRRNARLAEAAVDTVDYHSILVRDDYLCHICAQPIDPAVKKGPARLEFDHVVPLQPRPGEPQGSHSTENIKPSHRVCNRRKWNRPMEHLTDFDRRGPLSSYTNNQLF